MQVHNSNNASIYLLLLTWDMGICMLAHKLGRIWVLEIRFVPLMQTQSKFGSRMRTRAWDSIFIDKI